MLLWYVAYFKDSMFGFEFIHTHMHTLTQFHKILSSTNVFNTDDNKQCFLSSKSAY